MEGRFVVERLLASDFEVDSVLVDERHADSITALISEETRLFVCPDDWVEHIVGFKFHRGVLACGRRRPSLSLQDVFSQDRARRTLVICSEVQDPENMGGVLRNCAAFGVDAVLFDQNCVDPLARRVIRVSMGNVFKLPLIQCPDLPTAAQQLREDFGVQLAATVLDTTAEALETARRPDRFALVFGSEGHGLANKTSEMCDRRITLPMQRETDSLNVATATGVFLYHFTRSSSFQ